MENKTRIIEVLHENGTRATAAPIRPNATLFEIAEGPHKGKRGGDVDLFGLVGQLDWDKTEVSIYETGEHRPA